MIEIVPGWTCHWFTGALSGRGHGRLAGLGGRTRRGDHRPPFSGFALAHGLEELLAVPVLGHRCDMVEVVLAESDSQADALPACLGKTVRRGTAL